MPRPSFTSVPEVEVRPPSLEKSITMPSTRRQTRSASKRLFDQFTEPKEGDGVNGAASDLNLQEIPGDTEERSPPKRARKSASAKNQAAWKRDLQERLKESEKKNKDLESKLKKVTTESVLNARSGTKGVWDQAKIEAEFKTVKRDVKSWVKKYGTTQMISTFSNGAKKDIASACNTEQYRGVFSVDDFADIQELPKGAQLLLEGFLYGQSVYNLIDRPFLFVDAVLQEHSHPNKALSAVGNYEQLFDDFAESLEACETFPDQAQRWTASVLQSLKRLIIPDPSDGIASHMKDEKLSSDPYRIYELGISQVASEFLRYSKPVKHLLREIEKKEIQPRHDDLKKIYRKIRELAYHTWCQPSRVYYYHEQHPFNPDYMEIDPAAIHGRQDMDLKKIKGSKVLIRLCPLIWGVMIHPINGMQRVVYLKQKVWSVDCQTFSQWKTSQSESPSEPSGAANEETKHTDNNTASLPDDNLEDTVPDGAVHVQETKHANDITTSPPGGNRDIVPELPGSAAEETNLTRSADTNDATKDDKVDAMEQD